MLNAQAKVIVKEGIAKSSGNPYQGVQVVISDGRSTISKFVQLTPFERDWCISVIKQIEVDAAKNIMETE